MNYGEINNDVVRSLVKAYIGVIRSRNAKYKPIKPAYATFSAWIAMRSRGYLQFSSDRIGRDAQRMVSAFSPEQLDEIYKQETEDIASDGPTTSIEAMWLIYNKGGRTNG